jgi:predicted TPR repeat methyltransferase
MKAQQNLADLLSRAFALLDSGRVAEARRLARTLEAARPEPAALPYLLGLLALAEGQGRKAAQHLARAAARSPGAPPPLLALARAQVQQDRSEEAKLAYRRLLCAAPDLAAGWRELAELRLAGGDLRAAFSPLAIACRLEPFQAASRGNLGIAARARGELDFAERCFCIAILLDPGHAKSYANRAGLSRHRRQPAIADARRAVLLAGDAAALIELGQALLDTDPVQALAQFAAALAQLPGHAEPHWLAAEALRRLGRNDEAARHYRAVLELDRDDRFGARLALARIGAGALPERAAAAHVEALYDQYAGSFERNLVDELAYRGPQIIMDGLRRAGIAGPLAICDAGCGTGLMGQAIKPWASRLVGIDLSANMAEQARRRGIYDEIIVGDLLAALAVAPARYDLIVAADVFIYLGDLHGVAAAAFAALRPGGTFAFTVERSEGDAVALRDSGRFAHSQAHLRQVTADAGFALRCCDAVATRRENGQPVPGLLCIVQKP